MVTDGPYYGGGGGSVYRETYVDDDYEPGYSSYNRGYGGSYGGGYGGGVVYTNSYYYGGRYYDSCPYCHHHPCTCRSRHSDVRIVRRESHDHDHRSSSNNNNSKDNDIKLVRYRQGGGHGDLPSGYHDPQWFKNRGISVKQNTFKERDGDLRGRAPSRDNDRHDHDRHDDDKKDDDHKKGKKH